MQQADATIVIDLAYGDCGKGTIVDYLARTSPVHTVVRFNGGPQAGHNVVTPEGAHHTFSQIGSGTLAGPSIATLLSRFMLIEPYALLNEIGHLQEIGAGPIWDRLFIDSRCMVITPAHQAANRLREMARGAQRHGTCGQGVGEAMAAHLAHPELTLRAADMSNPALVQTRLRAVADFTQHELREAVFKLQNVPDASRDLDTLFNLRWVEVAVETYRYVAKSASILLPEQVSAIFHKPGEIIFEGAQGVLLDEDFGFHPHTTWSRTTSANARALLREARVVKVPRRIGVLRSYFTRHGDGPFVTEDDRLRDRLHEPHNTDAGHQGQFRVGVFDAVAARYAAEVADVEALALTHLDRISKLPDHFCAEYRTRANANFRLSPPTGSDLQERNRITLSLANCKPVFRSFSPGTPDAFIAAVAKEIGLPVRFMSFGPRATDKRTCLL